MNADCGGRAVMTVLRPDEPGTPEPVPVEPKTRWNTAELRRKVLVGAIVAWAVAITVLVAVRGGDDPPPAVATPAASPSPSATASPWPRSTRR